MKMKALSVRQPFASLIAAGTKTIEIRSRPTHYRGELLICASAKALRGLAVDQRSTLGHALCTVRVTGCRPLTLADLPAAGITTDLLAPPGLAAPIDVSTSYAWILEDPRPVTPFPVKGRLSFFPVELPHV